MNYLKEQKLIANRVDEYPNDQLCQEEDEVGSKTHLKQLKQF